MVQALINANILTSGGFCSGYTVMWEAGRIVGVCPDGERPENVKVQADLGGAMLVPGFIDLQVNGGGGVLFNDDPSVAAIKTIGTAHRKFGTTGFFPTLITDDNEKIRQAIEAVDEAIREGVPSVLGIHLEGPFLNPVKRGVHDVAKIRLMRKVDIDLITGLGRGKTLVTLAPETVPPAYISELVRRGVTVCAGHTNADYEQTLAALGAGVSGFTHLFNAMPQLSSRAPGPIAVALEDDRAWCGLIVDGHHVHPAMLRLALRAKTDGRFCLVTDAMPGVGMRDKNFRLGTEEIRVEDGKCVTHDGTLAGSDLDMMAAVRNAVNLLGLSVQKAVALATAHPARFCGLAYRFGQICPGLQADFVQISADLQVEQVWINGVTGRP